MRQSIQQWGPSALPTASSMEAHKPCCVVVVDLSGARFFRYWPGKMTELDEAKSPFRLEPFDNGADRRSGGGLEP